MKKRGGGAGCKFVRRSESIPQGYLCHPYPVDVTSCSTPIYTFVFLSFLARTLCSTRGVKRSIYFALFF